MQTAATLTSVSPTPSILAPPAAFVADAEAIGIAFDPGDLERLGRYLALLIDTNTRFNLTRIVEPAEAWRRHVLDSLSLVPLIGGLEAGSVIDIGSGGGVPGLPLAAVLPDTRFTLLEATGKKARFLEEAVAALGLENTVVVNDRAETAGHDAAHRARYDAVLARAVGTLNVLLELTVPFAIEGGHVLAVKGARAEDEIVDARQALHVLHARVTETRRTATGTIVVVEKMRPTPRRYPRRPGEPKRTPLGGGAP